MASLLDDVGDVLGGIGKAGMSLLAPVVGGGQLPAGADDPAAVPAFLAFASRMAQAGAPTLGPPQPLINVLPQAIAAGAGTAMQAHQLPLLMDQVRRETALRDALLSQAQQDAALKGVQVGEEQIKAAGAASDFEVQRQRNLQILNELSKGVGASAATSDQNAPVVPDMSLPRPLRYNNPMGLAGQGSAGSNVTPTDSIAIYRTPEEGIAAARDLLLGKAGDQPITLQTIANSVWKPADPAAYTKNLASITGYSPTAPLNVQDPATLHTVLAAIARIENGRPVDASLIDRGIAYKPGSSATQPAGAPSAAPGPGMSFDAGTKAWYPSDVLANATVAQRAAITAGDKEDPLGQKARNKVLLDFNMQRTTQTAPGIQTANTGKQSEAPVGATVQSALTPDEVKTMVPNSIPGMDYWGSRYVSGPLTGQLNKAEPIAPRSAGLPFQQAQAVQESLLRQPAMEDWQRAQNRYQQLIDSLNQHTRAGDEGAILALGKIFDPNAVVRNQRIEMAEKFGGIQQWIQERFGRITGEAGMPDDVRQQIAELATAEMRSRDMAAMQQVQQARAFAGANGIQNPHEKIMPLFTTEATGAEQAGELGQLPGMKFKAPAVWDAEKRLFLRPGQAGAGAAPPAPQPAGATQPAPAPAPPSPAPAAGAILLPGQVTADRLKGMDAASLRGLGQYITAHPASYSPSERQAVAKALRGLTQ